MLLSRRRRRAERADPAERALAELIELHADAMYRVAVSVVRDPHLAHDVVQEAVMRAWRSEAGWRQEGSQRAWLLSITHNTAVSMLRRTRDEAHDPAAMPERVSSDDIERESDARAEMAVLAEALDRLDPLSRSILVMRDVEGVSYQDIADGLAVPLATVKTRLLRARRELQRAVERERTLEARA